MTIQVLLTLRRVLPLLSCSNTTICTQSCSDVTARYGSETQRLLYDLLNDPELPTRQQAALALHTLDQWAAAYPTAPSFRSVYITCLGPLHIFQGNREIRFQDWMTLQGGRAGWLKVLGVFAYLVHRGRSGATRDEIGAAVWDRQVSASSIARTLSTLRKTLAQLVSPLFVTSALHRTPERWTLASDTYLTDVQIFDRLMAVAIDIEDQVGLDAACPLYTYAMSLYAGSYMEGISAAHETYHERRQHLLNSFVIAVERLAEHAYTRHQYQRCIALCQQGLDADLASEEITVWLLRAWKQLHIRGEVEHAYQTYLRAAEIDPQSAFDQEDKVVQVYQQLHECQQSS